MTNEYTPMEYVPDPFSKVDWNMLQALLWIYYGAESSDSIRETDDSLFEDDDPEDMPSSVLYFLGEGENGFALEETEMLLLCALQEGKIKGYGVPDRKGMHQEIPAEAWLGLELFIDESMAGSIKLPDVTTWHDIKLNRVDVMGAWNTEDTPEANKNGNSRPRPDYTKGINEENTGGSEGKSQVTNTKTPRELRHNPRKQIYRLVWEKLLTEGGLEYRWRGIVDAIAPISYDEDKEKIIGPDDIGDPSSIKRKAFENSFSMMKNKLK